MQKVLQHSARAPKAQVESSGPEGYGHSIWEFDGEHWQLKKTVALEGGIPSAPPSLPGKFKGQLRSTACVAA